jgi:hypothetical protein
MEEDDEFGESSASFSSMAEIQQQQIPDGDDDILLIGYSAPNCTPVTEAIKAQGINDLTR